MDCYSTGISETNIATHLTISPNPTTSDAVINFGLSENGTIIFEVCDLLGNAIYTISDNYDAGEYYVPLDTREMPPGNYIIRLLYNGKQIGIEKFIKH